MGKQQWIGGWFSGAKSVSSSKQVVNSSDDHAAREQYADNLMNQGDLQEAEKIYRELIAEGSSNHIVYGNLSKILGMQSRFDELTGLLKKALELNPVYPEAHNYLGNLLKQKGDLLGAIASYNTAIQLNPGFSKAHLNLGIAFQEQRNLNAAIASYNTAIQHNPCFVEAHISLGNALKDQRNLTAAIASYNTAIQLEPDFPGAHNNLANTLLERGDLPAALASFNTVLQLKPDYPFVAGLVAHLRSHDCQWSELAPLVSQITQYVSADEPITPPFPLLALVDDPHLHRKAAATWVREMIPTNALGPLGIKPRGEKIHIAYLSADFHDHATSYLMAELFELHDRSRFELTAISFGPVQDSIMRQRLAAAFDRFEEVSNISDICVARMCREIGVDLAVDLKGFTQDYRAGILAHRCAPIQINWLGYPGTMAAPFIDYIVADRILVSEKEVSNYCEKLIWLPDSYQVNDSKRRIADKSFTRSECGLPDSGFVFCCFNNNYKILPRTFDVWMRILERVPGSVLWLLEGNPASAANLRREAIGRGLSAERLIFARRIPLAEHLARHRLADLFVDTWPYNAHTTASDALWAGLPVLTRSGRSFASRVAASLLQAIGLPELITHSDQQYEDLAVELAMDPCRLEALHQRLADNRLTHPLFNCHRFTRSLELAYVQVMERHWTGAEPDHLEVAPTAEASIHCGDSLV